MSRWTGVVFAAWGAGSDDTGSRIPVYLHPLAGRPIIWHTVASIAAVSPSPDRILVLAGADLPDDIFADIPTKVPVQLSSPGELRGLGTGDGGRFLIVDAASAPAPAALEELVQQESGSWFGPGSGAAAAVLPPDALTRLPESGEPMHIEAGLIAADARMRREDSEVVVRTREQLATLSGSLRDRVVSRLMEGGATFLLPDSVLVDLDVRIGRDTIIYPGVVLEGQTTIGSESVIGPGCRIIDSWVGSGVELKGWNYISHTSVRNRAILEPYVRRGFD